MRLWRQIGRQHWAKATIGIAAAEYLRFVGRTTRFTLEPADIYARGEADMPIILAFWHGQHLLAPVARKGEHRVNMLVSRHRDGEINAIAAARLGVGTIRGSGTTAAVSCTKPASRRSRPCSIRSPKAIPSRCRPTCRK